MLKARSCKLRHKFNAKRVDCNGEKFDSKIEFEYFNYLSLLKKTGEILFFLRRVPVRIPGGTTLWVDYLIFYANGEVRFQDVKGVETDAFKIKKRTIEALYPFEIELIKRGDF